MMADCVNIIENEPQEHFRPALFRLPAGTRNIFFRHHVRVMMRVKTLDRDSLENHASRLAAKVAFDMPSGGYDVIVGIRRGGSVVCDALCRHIPKSAFRLRTDVSLQRPSTKRKTARSGAMLRKLPYSMLNLMRMAEALMLSVINRFSRDDSLRHVELPESLTSVLETQENPCILLIDDAIDSGRTISEVAEAFKKVNCRVRIKTAVITVTTTSPCFTADYYIYNNHTLIRFPWSDDYKIQQEEPYS